MAARVKLKSSGVKELLNNRSTRDMLTERAEAVLETARANAPVGPTGNYRDGLTLQQDTTDRAVVRVVGTAPHSHLVEANTGNLARALDSAGG